METFVEYDDTKLCPYGSQKPYSACCKLKPLKWGYAGDGKLVKQIHMSPDLEEALKKTEQLFEEYYGRKPGKEDYVLSFIPIYQDEMLFNTMQAMQLAGIPPENIYAYYKTNGLLLCSLNDELVSDKDKEDFLNYCAEYRRAIKEPLTDSMNTLQFTALGNELLISTFDKSKEMIINSLNDFIHRHSNEPTGIYNYEMKTEIDYLLFSAIKTIKTIKRIALIVNEQIPECIHALGRSLFENYMYLNKINCDPTFFKRKLLPKIDKDHFQFIRRKDGKIDHYRVSHIETGEIYNIRVVISDLKNSFSNFEDQGLCDLYYSNSC